MVDLKKKHFKDVFADVIKLKEEKESLQSVLNPRTKVELVEKKTIEWSGKSQMTLDLREKC